MSDGNDKLVYTTAIDSSGWLKGLDAGETALAKFHDSATSKLSSLSIAAPKIEVGSPAPMMGGRSPALELAAGFVAIGPLIASGIRKGLAPVQGIVGDAAKTISKQLDGQLQFHKLEAAISHLRGFWRGELDHMGDDAKRFHETASKMLNPAFLRARLRQRNPATFDPGKNGPSAAGGLGSPRVSGSSKAAVEDAKETASALRGLAGPLAVVAAGGVAVYKSFDFLARGVASASSLNETLSKTDAILGAGSPAVKKFADDMASRFGLVKGQTLDAAASFAGLGKSLGNLRGDNLAGFSTQFTKLAADLSSFSNIDFDEASRALTVGLSGNQSDTLKQLGVVMTEDTVKQYAYANGIARVGQELTEQQKLMARSGLIMKQLADVSGDLEKTQGGTANQWRKFSGTVANLGTSIGTILLPAVNAGVGLLNEFASSAFAAFEGNKETIAGWVDFFVDSIDFAAAVVSHLPAAYEVAGLMIYEKVLQIGDWVDALGKNAVIVAEYIGRNWKELGRDAFSAWLTYIQNSWKNLQALGTAIGEWFADPTQGFHINWTPLLDGFQATAEKFPELLKPVLTDMSKEIGEAAKPILDDYSARRMKRTAAAQVGNKPAADMASPSLNAASMAKPLKAEAQFSGALELGSDDAYSAIVKQLSGRGQGFENLEKINRENGSKQDTTNKLLAENLRRNNGRAMEWVG